MLKQKLHIMKDRIASNETVSSTLTELKNALRDKISLRYPQYFRGTTSNPNLQEFQKMLLKGFEAVEVGCGQAFKLPFRVSNGDTLMYEFFILSYDLTFRLARRVMANGGAFEINVRGHSSDTRHSARKSVRGVHVVNDDEDSTYLFVFDNTYSWFRSKHVAYRISHHKAGEGKSGD